MPAIAGVAGSMLSGPIGGVVGSIANSIGGSLGKAVGEAGKVTNEIGGVANKVFGGIGKAFKGLFGHKQKHHYAPIQSPKPQPFSTINIKVSIFNNPTGPLQGLSKQMGDIAGVLVKIGGKSARISAESGTVVEDPGSDLGSTTALAGGLGSGAEYMMSQATAILSDPSASPEEVLVAEKLISQASGMFVSVARVLQQQHTMKASFRHGHYHH